MDDLISRQAAIDYLLDALYDLDEADLVDKEFIEEELKRVPSIQPKQKTYQWGRQILFNDGCGGVKVGYACPACKTYVPNKGNYCSNCGAKFTKR